MMRSTSYTALLVALLMFQSLWNVAAAFCVHESVASTQQTHFGHHQNTLCPTERLLDQSVSSSPHSKIHTENPTDAILFELGDDHQDHVPSMIHLIMQDAQHHVWKKQIELRVTPIFAWMSHYQPPDLGKLHPPPQFSPLLVG